MKSHDLAVHRCGQGDPIIFLHGFFSDHRLWDPIIQTLRDDFTCLAVDLPGHGESGAWRGDWSDLLLQLDHLIASLPSPCHLIGYSMGARIVGQMLTQSGPPIHTAILISPTAGFQPMAARQRRLRDHQLAAQINHQTITESAKLWGQQPIFSGQEMSPKPTLKRQHHMRCSQEPRHLAFALRTLGSGTRAIVSAPVRGHSIHLLSGDRLALDVRRTQALARKWPCARTTWLNQSGHNPIIEDPTGLSAHFMGLLAVD